MARQKFKVLTLSYIGDRLRHPGEIVELDPRAAGDNLERIGGAKPAAPAAAPIDGPSGSGDEATADGDGA